MKKKWIFVAAPLAIVAFIVIGGQVVMHLWNWLLPMLFGWRQITFWQAVGLLALCRILFGGWGGRGSQRSNFRRRLDKKWERMTPEEREKFRQRMGSVCGGGFEASTGGSKEPA